MNIQETLDSIDSQIERLKKQREAVVLIGEKLSDYPEQVGISTFMNFVDFDNPTRAQAVKLITHLKTGKWDKEPSSVEGKINYTNSTFVPGVTLRIYAAEPPHSCKVVEVDVEIPAQPARTVKQKKLVCKDHELQAI
jgi:hypothetical protein